MTTTDLFKTVRIKCIEQSKTLKDLATELKLDYNYMYQCLKGQRNSDEIINKVKTHLNIQ